MDSVLTRVSEGLERGSAALGGIINDIQYTGQVSGDRDIGSQVSRGLDSLLGPRGGPGSLLLSPGHPAWRQLSLFSVWTALKVTVNKNNNKAVSNSDVQVYFVSMLSQFDNVDRMCRWPCWACVTSAPSLTRGRR